MKSKEIKIPTKCSECKHIGNYTTGPFARNPHYCCELIWQLFKQDYRVNPKELDEHCPYLDLDFAIKVSEIKKSLQKELENGR